MLDSCGGAWGVGTAWSREGEHEMGGAITAGERHSCTPRARDLPLGEHSRFAYRRCAPAPWSAALSRGGAGAYGKRYRPTRHSLRYNTLLCPELSSHAKSRSSLYQVSVSVDSHLYCTLASTSVHSIGFYRLPVIRNRLSVVHGSRLPYLFTYL